jgi:hypothetical protein
MLLRGQALIEEEPVRFRPEYAPWQGVSLCGGYRAAKNVVAADLRDGLARVKSKIFASVEQSVAKWHQELSRLEASIGLLRIDVVTALQAN